MDRSLKYYKVLEKELRKKNGQKKKENFSLLQERAKLMEYAKRCFQYNMYPQGVEALIQASVLGESEASFLVGTCYEKGIGVEKDLGRAYDYYKVAAENDDPRALEILGAAYLSGHPYQKDEQRGIELYEKAALSGNKRCQKHLADLFQEGKLVQKDVRIAKYFLNLYQKK